MSYQSLTYFHNGRFVDSSEATVSVDSAVVGRGLGVFEGIRGYWNPSREELYLFRLEEHFERQLRSARTVNIRIPYTVAELCELSAELVRRNGFRQDVFIRPLAYKSGEDITAGALFAPGTNDGYTISIAPFTPPENEGAGLRCMVSSWRRPEDNAIPARAKVTGAYVNASLARTEALENGYDECILLNSEGKVSEGSVVNLFLVVDGVLVTPPVGQSILEGITRRTVIELARESLGLRVQERPVARSELYTADECFITGSGDEVRPVRAIDNRSLGESSPGPLTSRIRRAFSEMVSGEAYPARWAGEHWLQPCYSPPNGNLEATP